MTVPGITAAVASASAHRTRTMLDAGRVERAGEVGQTPELDENGDVIQPPPVVVYEGRCTIADPSDAQRAQTTNDQSGIPNSRVLRLPVDSPALRPGDLFTVTASRFAPSLVGDSFVVQGEEERSYGTYRRYMLRGSSWLPA